MAINIKLNKDNLTITTPEGKSATFNMFEVDENAAKAMENAKAEDSNEDKSSEE